jgi:adenine-specific DNA-methyltransferase
MADLKDLLVTSPDQNKERLEALRELFPDLFTDEGRLNPAELKRIFEDEVTTDREQYAFTWKGKGKSKRHAFTPSRASLTYDAERSVNPEKANGNMIIEGENLEVLKLLTSAYREQIQCIYIDPPYNKDADVIYKDNYAKDRKEYWEENGAYKDGVKLDTNTEASGRYHSDWLSVMYARLLVARQLLKEDGVIFVSIDDSEVHNLHKLMDEVFGEENFILQAPTIMNLKGNQDEFGFAGTHEYTLVYAKRKESVTIGEFNISDSAIGEGWEEDEVGFYKKGANLKATGANAPRSKRPNLFYPIYVNLLDQKISLTKENENFVEVLPLTKGKEMSWRWEKAKVQKEHTDIIISVNDGDISLYKKQRPKLGDLPTKKPKSLFYKPEYSSGNGTNQFNQILSVTFGNGFRPKPVELIKDFIFLTTSAGDIVLDFFAGSGTTAQAIMELNQQDNLNRKFLLIQLPERIDDKKHPEAYQAGYRTISQITIERNKRVVEGYGNNPQPLDTGFKVYQLTKSHFPRAEFQPDPDKSNEENVELLKRYIAEKEASFQIAFEQDDVLDEVLLKHGFKLNFKLTKQKEFGKNTVYLAEEGDQKAYICLDTNIAEETIDFFKTHKDTTFICLERALDTTKKWNLNHSLGERLKAL